MPEMSEAQRLTLADIATIEAVIQHWNFFEKLRMSGAPEGLDDEKENQLLAVAVLIGDLTSGIPEPELEGSKEALVLLKMVADEMRKATGDFQRLAGVVDMFNRTLRLFKKLCFEKV